MALPDVAIGGRMQVGKTTCAQHLVARHGYVRRGLADPIKEIARREFDWDGRKDARGRKLLQDLGSAGRAYDAGVWLRRFDEWFASRPSAPVVVDDVRLPAEADRLRRLGFVFVLVLRPGFVPEAGASLTGHETEAGLDRIEPDLVILNQGTIADLRRAVDVALASWAGA